MGYDLRRDITTLKNLITIMRGLPQKYIKKSEQLDESLRLLKKITDKSNDSKR